jgi:IS30 family transposase
MPASTLLMPEAKKAVAMHEQGYSQPQIAQALGRSRKAIRTGLRHMGVASRSPADGYRAWLRLRDGVGNRVPLPHPQ